jgi:hypothetical protein
MVAAPFFLNETMEENSFHGRFPQFYYQSLLDHQCELKNKFI